MAEKLYGIYSIVSNKTVRVKENFCVRWKNKNKEIPGKEMVKTNRGYFLDGKNIDEKSVATWFATTGLDRHKNPQKSDI